MNARNRHRAPRPLGRESLRELAIRYVGHYATSRAKLASYLLRKVRERGWDEEEEADIDGLVERFAEQGYVDDAGYAMAKSRALISRGYGPRRLSEQMRSAGIGEEDGAEAKAMAQAEAAEAALRLARKRRIGPFADQAADAAAREKAMAMLIRAGHSFALARAIADMPPGDLPGEEELEALARRNI